MANFFLTNNAIAAVRLALMTDQAPGTVINQAGASSVTVVVERRVPRDKIDYKRYIPNGDLPRPMFLQTILRGDKPGFESIIAQSMRTPHTHPRNIYFWRHTNIMHVAAVVGDVETIEKAKACGISVNAVNENGSTPLHLACENNVIPAIKKLIAMGANLNAQDMFGNTPMMRAVIAGVENSIEALTAVGANPNIVNRSGMTPAEMEKEVNFGSARAFQATAVHAIYFLPRLVRRACFKPPVQDAEYVALGTINNQRGLSTSASVATVASTEALLEDADDDPEKIGESVNGDSSESALVHDVQAIQAESVRLRTPSTLRPRGLTMPPIYGLVMTILFLVVLVANAVCDIKESQLNCSNMSTYAQNECWIENSQCRASINVSSGMRWGFLLILWIFAFIEAMKWGNKNLYYRLSSDRGFSAYLKFLASNPGKLRMDIACFHMEARQDTIIDKDGRTSTRVRMVKVYTHRAFSYLDYDEYWLEHNDFEPFTGICMVSFSSDFELADDVTKELFENEQKEFIRANDRDVSFEFNLVDEFQVPGGFVCLDGLASVRLIDYKVYTVFSMLMLSVIYRMWINSISSEQTIHSKRFFWKA